MGAQTRIPIDIAGTWMNDIEYFKRELDDARDALIGIAPDQFHCQLHGFDCPMETWHDLHRWKAQTIEKIIKAVEPEPDGRAACPLCGSWGTAGKWTVPTGLEMHLERAHTVPCPVMQAAFKMHRDKNLEKFEAADKNKPKAFEARKKTEPTILVDPAYGPELWTCGSRSDLTLAENERRSPDELVRTEHLLQQAGFQIEKTDNVTGYRTCTAKNGWCWPTRVCAAWWSLRFLSVPADSGNGANVLLCAATRIGRQKSNHG